MDQIYLKKENDQLKKQIDILKKKLKTSDSFFMKTNDCGLTSYEIQFYSRQLILPQITLKGQLKLKNSSILVIGAGGLGSSCLLYLASSGVGKVGIVDYDRLELNNLHRQVIHRLSNISQSKSQSAKENILKLNPSVKVEYYEELFEPALANKIVPQYDIVVDCSDNVPTRYLVNDICIKHNKQLVSGSAIRFQGQLMIYNKDGNSPCYRCIFPQPPPPETIGNCSDNGVVGAVTGVIGSLQALETLKLIVGGFEQKNEMVIFCGETMRFQNIKMRNRNKDCLCNQKENFVIESNYEQFCNSKANDKNRNLKILSEEERVFPKDLMDMSPENSIIIDVRKETEFDVCKIPNSINIPLKNLYKNPRIIDSYVKKDNKILFLCRRGNDSQLAVQLVKKEYGDKIDAKDVQGGLYKWKNDVDSEFPIY